MPVPCGRDTRRRKHAHASATRIPPPKRRDTAYEHDTVQQHGKARGPTTRTHQDRGHADEEGLHIEPQQRHLIRVLQNCNMPCPDGDSTLGAAPPGSPTCRAARELWCSACEMSAAPSAKAAGCGGDDNDGEEAAAAATGGEAAGLRGVQYVSHRGLLGVVPYAFVHSTTAKERWHGRTIESVCVDEFRLNDAAFYALAFRDGRIRLDGVAARPDVIVPRHGVLLQHVGHRHEPPVRCPVPVPVCCENESVIVVDKPCSVPVHPSGAFAGNALTSMLCAERGLERLFLVNRIDRLTSGIVIVAKSGAVAHRMAAQFAARDVRKVYVARVAGARARSGFCFSQSECYVFAQRNAGRWPREASHVPADAPCRAGMCVCRGGAGAADTIVLLLLMQARVHLMRSLISMRMACPFQRQSDAHIAGAAISWRDLTARCHATQARACSGCSLTLFSGAGVHDEVSAASSAALW